MSSFQKGQKVEVIGNSIFDMMGYSRVTGTVFMVYPEGKSLALKCDQTRAIELVELNDGITTVIDETATA
jgi:hypothetical protein